MYFLIMLNFESMPTYIIEHWNYDIHYIYLL